MAETQVLALLSDPTKLVGWDGSQFSLVTLSALQTSIIGGKVPYFYDVTANLNASLLTGTHPS